MIPGQTIVEHLDDPSKMADHVLSLHLMAAEVTEAQEKIASAANQSAPQTGTTGITQTQTTAILDRLLQLECRSERAQRELVN